MARKFGFVIYLSAHFVETFLRFTFILPKVNTGFIAWLQPIRHSDRGGLEVTHQTAVRKLPRSIPGSDKDLCVCFYFCVFTPFVKNTIFVIKFCNFLCNFNSFSIPNIQHLWPIIRVSRYSIFKDDECFVALYVNKCVYYIM